MPLVSPAEGPVDVLVRPEQLELGPIDDTAGVEGTVELVEFVGHDTTYLVHVDDHELQVRRPSMPVVGRGDRVSVRFAAGPVSWFPPEDRARD